MILVKVVRDQSRNITGLFVSGHSGYGEAGSDIICAGASTLVYTLANALERICGLDTKYTTSIREDTGDGEVFAEIIIPEGKLDEEASLRAQVIMETIVLGFISLAGSVNVKGGKYIGIEQN